MVKKKKCSNYRPLNLTLTIFKLFEKYLKKRLLNCLDEYNLFISQKPTIIGTTNNLFFKNSLN